MARPPARPLIYVNTRRLRTCEHTDVRVVTRTKSLHRRRTRFPLKVRAGAGGFAPARLFCSPKQRRIGGMLGTRRPPACRGPSGGLLSSGRSCRRPTRIAASRSTNLGSSHIWRSPLASGSRSKPAERNGSVAEIAWNAAERRWHRARDQDRENPKASRSLIDGLRSAKDLRTRRAIAPAFSPHPIGDDGGQPMLNQPVARAAKRVRTPPAAAAIMALTHSFMTSSSIARSGPLMVISL